MGALSSRVCRDSYSAGMTLSRVAGRNGRREEQYMSRVVLARMVWIRIKSALGVLSPAGLAVDAQGEAERLA